jgi:hypothetical protein
MLILPATATTRAPDASAPELRGGCDVRHGDIDPFGTDEALLGAFLQGDEDARDALPRRFGEDLLHEVRAIVPDLAALALDEDVVQRAYELLLTRPAGHFDPDRGSARSYLRTTLRRAARDVRAENAPPGTRTRAVPGKQREPALSLDRMIEATDGESLAFAIDDHADTVVRKVTVDELVARARRDAMSMIADAMTVMLTNDIGIVDAARIIGVSRLVLRREFDRWIAGIDLGADD